MAYLVKDPVSDFFAYMMILIQRPIKIGDFIKLDDNTFGVVRKITLRAVLIRKKNSVTMIVPNTEVMRKIVTNWNYRPGFVACDDIHLPIPYKEDPGRVREIVLKVLDESPYILKSPKPIVRLESFDEFGYVYTIRVYVSSNYTLDIWDIASNIRIELVQTLRKNGIQIAIPMRRIIAENPKFPPSH